MKILGVDDNKDITDLLASVLESRGNQFVGTTKGRQALKLIKENEFDAILLDLAMPDFSGFDLIDSLEEDGLLDKQPIILFTASTITDEKIEELQKRGVHSCLKKPSSMVEILFEIESIDTQKSKK